MEFGRRAALAVQFFHCKSYCFLERGKKKIPMRLSLIRACAISAVSAIALAACAGHGIVPSSQSALTPQNMQPLQNPAIQDELSPLGITTCATSPPQFLWILKGACSKVILKSAGANFALQKYRFITVSGTIGGNNVKTSATIYIADANDKKDILPYKGKAFPPYKPLHGRSFIYAVAINESKDTIVPKAEHNKPVLKYVITDDLGFPGKVCDIAVYGKQRNGLYKWTSLTIQAPPKGKTVTLTQYAVPPGFQFPSKTPVYFAAFCS